MRHKVFYILIILFLGCPSPNWQSAHTHCPCVDGFQCVNGWCKRSDFDAKVEIIVDTGMNQVDEESENDAGHEKTDLADTINDIGDVSDIEMLSEDTDSYLDIDIEHERDITVDKKDACQPKTCEDFGFTCGTMDNGCGQKIDCGKCKEHEKCQSHQCIMFPWCGDGKCNADEDCESCPRDCACSEGKQCHNGVCMPEPCSPECQKGEFCFESKCYKKKVFIVPTNQNKCYDDTKKIDCPSTAGSEECSKTAFCGQDAQYPDNQRNFEIQTKNNEKVVIDSITHLMWQQDITPGKTWKDAIIYCDNLNYAGYTDWRLPTVKELTDLVNYSRIGPSIDTSHFPDTPPVWFWTSNQAFPYPSNAWVVDFNEGYVYYSPVNNYNLIRCVRNSNNNTGLQDFIVRSYKKNNPIVMDMMTGLMWTKNYIPLMNWKQALAYCESLNYSGFKDWRLPNINELSSLIDYNQTNPASTFPDIPTTWFWSSTPFSSDGRGVWVVYFSDGRVNHIDPTKLSSVLCVRMKP